MNLKICLWKPSKIVVLAPVLIILLKFYTGRQTMGGRVNIFPPTYMDNIHWIWVVVIKFVP